MTHTAEPMTLAQISDAMGEKLRAVGSYAKWTNLHHAIFEWREAIDAELAKQRNAVEVTEQMVRTFQLAEMQFSESAANRGELIDPALAVEFALKQTLSAVASRDREDAEHQLRDLHRAIESNLTGTSIEQDKNPTEYKEGLIKAYRHCQQMVRKRIDAIRTVRDAMHAARREKKP